MKQPSTGSFSHTGSCAWSGRVASFLGPWRYLAAQHSRDFRHYRGEHDFWQRFPGAQGVFARGSQWTAGCCANAGAPVVITTPLSADTDGFMLENTQPWCASWSAGRRLRPPALRMRAAALHATAACAGGRMAVGLLQGGSRRGVSPRRTLSRGDFSPGPSHL